ncbi:hypothetical protein PM082_024119 [Marasmius tenuissimus]|nr:hypothetical protein PM082_024119 [Marasmius tenuissimus]
MQLALDATSSQLWPHWEPSVSPWVVFILRNLILNLQLAMTLSETEGRTNVLEHILFSLPDLLDFENKVPSSRPVKQGASSYLQPLSGQIWLYLIDTEHPNINPWSMLLIDLTICSRTPPSASFMSSLSPREDANLLDCPKLYSIDSDLGKMLLIRLNRKLLRLKGKDMRTDELFEFKNFLMSLNTASDCLNVDTNPICMGEENRNAALRSMTRILTIFLRKKTSLHKSALNSPEMMHTNGIVIALLVFFAESFKLDTPSRVQQIVESGIVQSLYYAADCFYEMDNVYRSRETIFETTFAEAVAAVLDRIAIFLVYHSVLRPFVRNTGGFWRAYLGKLPTKIEQSKVLRNAWINVLGKADQIFGIRKGLKQTTLCHYAQVNSIQIHDVFGLPH